MRFFFCLSAVVFPGVAASGSSSFVHLDVVVDGRRHFLEARSDDSAAEAAAKFCRLHRLHARDCQRLATELALKSGRKQPEDDAAHPPVVPTTTAKTSATKTNTETRQGEEGGAYGSVDFSRRVAPELAVVWNGHPLTLFRYGGETVPQAVTRFCRGAHLDDGSCATVRRNFECLVRNDTCAAEEPPHLSHRLRRAFYSGFLLLVALAVVVLQSQQQ
mmetsp:Transcript_29619/g.95515  ORF Transcript_29619/g.95515 Transcript_29619/m.95515 type:complete len:217 (-) Transcript_29619:16-666(-)